MGGLVQASLLVEKDYIVNNFKGALFSSPLLMAAKDMAPLLQKLSGIVGALFPKMKTCLRHTVFINKPTK